MNKLNELTIVGAAEGLRAGEFTVRELWEACAETARARNPELNAYLEIFDADELALISAQERIDNHDPSLLVGIPLAIKDNILIEGKVASAASKMLENYRATYDATVIRKLKEAGALFVGRTNMDEFAMGSSTEHSAFGPTKNPLDPERVPGGSSGGSAAAVAAHLCIAALGSDTGGSIRQPAAYTGLVGLKPTYGAVSRSGLIAMGSSLDQIGPLTKTVEDARILYEAIRGVDPLDSTTIPEKLYPKRPVREKLVIGIPDFLNSALTEVPTQTFSQMCKKLEAEGHTLVPVTLPTNEYALAAYYVVMPAEVSTNLARLDGVRYGHAVRGETLLEDYVQSRTEGFGPETLRRILLGTFVLSSGYIDSYYYKAQSVRALLRREYDKAFEKVDVIMTPTTLAPAFAFGQKSDPLTMYLEDLFTVTANLTGMPAISVPAGLVDSLPIAAHFTAPHQGEERLFTIAKNIEKIAYTKVDADESN